MRKLKPIAALCIWVVLLIYCGNGSQALPENEVALLERIEKIENGLLPAVVFGGDDSPGQNIHELMERHSVPGISIAVINNGRIEWARAYGVKEENGEAADTDTLFLAGQISQAVTAIGALRLVEAGYLDLDEDVNNRLTSWQIPENEFTTTEKVTLRRILSHTSGLSVPYTRGYAADEEIPNLLQVLDGEEPANNEPIRVTSVPGSVERYSIGGYIVVQQLITDITGESYSEFISENVLSPLVMELSYCIQPLPGNLAANAATGHNETGETVRGRWRIYPELAAAGLWTTPTDLGRLSVEIQRAYAGEPNTILSQDTAEQILTLQNDNYGLGFALGGEGEWRNFSLEGHGNNYLSELFAYVSQGMGAVVMTNATGGEWIKHQILRAIAAEYDWPDFQPLEIEVAQLTTEALEAVSGRYLYRDRTEWLVRYEDGRILLEREGRSPVELFPISEDVFIEITFGFRYSFERDQFTGFLSPIKTGLLPH